MNYKVEIQEILAMDEDSLEREAIILDCLSTLVAESRKRFLAAKIVEAQESKPKAKTETKKSRGYTVHSDETKSKAMDMLKQGIDIPFIARETGVHRSTLYTWKARLKKEVGHEQQDA